MKNEANTHSTVNERKERGSNKEGPKKNKRNAHSTAITARKGKHDGKERVGREIQRDMHTHTQFISVLCLLRRKARQGNEREVFILPVLAEAASGPKR